MGRRGGKGGGWGEWEVINGVRSHPSIKDVEAHLNM